MSPHLPQFAADMSSGDLLQFGLLALGAGLAGPPLVAGVPLRAKDMLYYYSPCLAILAGIFLAPFSLEASWYLICLGLVVVAALIGLNLFRWHAREQSALLVFQEEANPGARPGEALASPNLQVELQPSIEERIRSKASEFLATQTRLRQVKADLESTISSASQADKQLAELRAAEPKPAKELVEAKRQEINDKEQHIRQQRDVVESLQSLESNLKDDLDSLRFEVARNRQEKAIRPKGLPSLPSEIPEWHPGPERLLRGAPLILAEQLCSTLGESTSLRQDPLGFRLKKFAGFIQEHDFPFELRPGHEGMHHSELAVILDNGFSLGIDLFALSDSYVGFRAMTATRAARKGKVSFYAIAIKTPIRTIDEEEMQQLEAAYQRVFFIDEADALSWDKYSLAVREVAAWVASASK